MSMTRRQTSCRSLLVWKYHGQLGVGQVAETLVVLVHVDLHVLDDVRRGVYSVRKSPEHRSCKPASPQAVDGAPALLLLKPSLFRGRVQVCPVIVGRIELDPCLQWVWEECGVYDVTNERLVVCERLGPLVFVGLGLAVLLLLDS